MNINNPLVSVIINNYNKGAYLKKCLDSIKEQSYSNIEVIFWDDNSTDNSLEIFYKWSASIYNKDKKSNIKTKCYCTRNEFKYHTSKFVPLGVTRWTALHKCTGDYVAILDSDDWWAKEKLSLQIAAMPSWAGVSFTDCEIVDEMRCHIGETFHDRYPVPTKLVTVSDRLLNSTTTDHYKYLLTKYNYMPASTLLFNRNKLMKVIGSPTHYTSGEDYDWLLKVAERYGCFYYPRALTYYTIVDNSLTHNKRSSTRATWYEIDAAISSYNRTKEYKLQFKRHLIWLYCKLIWKQFVRESNYYE